MADAFGLVDSHVHIAGRLAGAVAVSGATSFQDHEIAQRAAALLGS